MKKMMTILFLSVFGLAILFLSYGTPIDQIYAAKPCYTCAKGGYVCFSGSDTFDKRKKAQKKYKCKVSGTSSCSDTNCNGRVVSNN